MKICCVTGHRPKGLPWTGDKDNDRAYYLSDMKDFLEKLITKHNFSTFICGGALGVDQDFARTIIELKKNYDIKLVIVKPCPNQDEKWSFIQKHEYARIQKKADNVITLYNHYTPYCMLERNKYMVDKSDLVIAYFNEVYKGGTFSTMNYAKKTNTPMCIWYVKSYKNEPFIRVRQPKEFMV